MSMESMKRSKRTTEYDVIVIGGGAAGMYSSVIAAKGGLRVLLLEKNSKLGRKLRITGKGRCNITANVDGETLLRNIPTGGRFLYSAFSHCDPSDMMVFFESIGVPVKTERGDRVFPVSDRAEDVVFALEHAVRKTGVTVKTATVTEILTDHGAVSGVLADQGEFFAPKVILATGGMSYPATGSTGDGYEMARQLGHTVTPISGSLVPLEIEGGECRLMAGLSLRNVALKLYGKKKKPVFEDFGEALFMHYGLSGPIILSASAHMTEKDGPYTLCLDLKPALDEKKLDLRILRDFEERKNSDLYDGLRGLLPAQMIPVILGRCGLSSRIFVRDVTKEQRRAILETIKCLRFTVVGKRPVEEAIITHGGVKVSEVHPATMESKLVQGLYFAGEILDCDAYTGGYNLQIAWSTAFAAGSSCGNSENTVV